MKDKGKRIFNFICYFCIAPMFGFILYDSIYIPFSILDILPFIGVWIWLVLAYKFLIKLFD